MEQKSLMKEFVKAGALLPVAAGTQIAVRAAAAYLPAVCTTLLLPQIAEFALGVTAAYLIFDSASTRLKLCGVFLAASSAVSAGAPLHYTQPSDGGIPMTHIYNTTKSTAFDDFMRKNRLTIS